MISDPGVTLEEIRNWISEQNVLAYLPEPKSSNIQHSKIFNSPAPLSSTSDKTISFASFKKNSKGIPDYVKGLVITETEVAIPEKSEATFIITDNARFYFAKICQHFFPPKMTELFEESHQQSEYIHSSAVIAPTAFIGKDVRIGERSLIANGAIIFPGVTIGEDCIIGPGTVIGWQGFGYERHKGEILHFPHYGGVEIGDRVEIGANTCVDKGSFSNTKICSDVKIDNLVHIAHNAVIESGTFVIAGSVVCGSATVGTNSWIAPNAIVGEGIHIGSDTVLGFGAVAKKDTEKGTTVAGAQPRIYIKS